MSIQSGTLKLKSNGHALKVQYGTVEIGGTAHVTATGGNIGLAYGIIADTLKVSDSADLSVEGSILYGIDAETVAISGGTTLARQTMAVPSPR